jgi:hypothetical protein
MSLIVDLSVQAQRTEVERVKSVENWKKCPPSEEVKKSDPPSEK